LAEGRCQRDFELVVGIQQAAHLARSGQQQLAVLAAVFDYALVLAKKFPISRYSTPGSKAAADKPASKLSKQVLHSGCSIRPLSTQRRGRELAVELGQPPKNLQLSWRQAFVFDKQASSRCH